MDSEQGFLAILIIASIFLAGFLIFSGGCEPYEKDPILRICNEMNNDKKDQCLQDRVASLRKAEESLSPYDKALKVCETIDVQAYKLDCIAALSNSKNCPKKEGND